MKAKQARELYIKNRPNSKEFNTRVNRYMVDIFDLIKERCIQGYGVLINPYILISSCGSPNDHENDEIIARLRDFGYLVEVADYSYKGMLKEIRWR